MTTAPLFKGWWFLSSLLMLACVAVGLYVQNPLVLLLAPLGFGLWLLMHYPKTLLYVLLAALPWSGEVTFDNGLGTDLPDEPLMLLAALLAVCTLCYRWRYLRRQKQSIFLWLLALQLVWIVITAIFSSHSFLSLKYAVAKSWYLAAFVAAPLLFLKSGKDWRRAVVVLYLSMLAVTTLTLIRHAALGFGFSSINPALVPFFRNHVTYSSLLVFMVPVGCFLLATTGRRIVRRWLIASLVLLAAALYFAYARGAWLALAVGAAAYVLLRARLLFAGFLLALVLTAAAFGWLAQNNRYVVYAHDFNTTIFHNDFSDHLAATYQLKDLSTAERFHRWVAAVRMAPESWATGFGPSTFYQHYKSYTVPAFKTWVSRNEEQSTVHNYFLLLLVEQGLLGLLLFLLLIGALFWQAQRVYHSAANPTWKLAAAALAVVMAMECTVNFLSDLIETDKVGSVFYLCVALMVMLWRMTRIRSNFTN